MTTQNFKNTPSLSSLGESTPTLSYSDTPTLSSSCLTRGSIIIQSGRSMVEMLGTLAIIGVLSIGGIAGYSYGMNKYHANAIVNDVNLRAVELLSQLSQGHTPNLDSWETTSAGQYPISLNSDNAPTNYYIKVEQVPFEVCNMIADMMPENVNILVDNDTQECGEGDNILDFEYEGFEGAQGPGEVIECPAGTSVDGEGGYVEIPYIYGNKCRCENADTRWDTTTSTCIPKDGTCSSYADCDKYKFCQFTTSTCTGDSIEIPTTGVCAEADSPVGTYGENGQFLVFASGLVACNWWSMQDFCASFGGRLATLEDFGCTDYNIDSCTSDGLYQAQAAMGIPGEFWSANLYDKNNPNSCEAWYFSIEEGIQKLSRDEYLYASLCVNPDGF